MENKHPLDRAGVRAQIIEALGVSPSAITNWKTRGVPIEHCLAIERLTKNAVTREELRPDDFWLIWPDLSAPTDRFRTAGKDAFNA